MRTRHTCTRLPSVALPSLALSSVVVASLLLLCGCESQPSVELEGPSQTDRVELVVFAASSLTEAFEELERGFEQANPDVDVQVTFAGSQILRLQIEQGAPVDVLASANESHMQALLDGGQVEQSQTFARNELVVIVPRNNPAGIERFDNLNEASTIVIGTDNAPVGIYTRQVLNRATTQLGEEFGAAVQSHIVSEESNARLVRTKVELGEADAAMVYRTDATASTRVRMVPIPAELNARASYPIGALADSNHPREASLFIDYVLSVEGQQALHHHGFVGE